MSARAAGRALVIAAALIAAVLGMVRVDLILRARSAYLEGEKWMEYGRKPELKKARLDAELAASGKKGVLARFERDQAMAESSLKYAYVWYQTAAELFGPPENRWSVSARVKMTEARALWEKELAVRKIPYQDYMLE